MSAPHCEISPNKARPNQLSNIVEAKDNLSCTIALRPSIANNSANWRISPLGPFYIDYSGWCMLSGSHRHGYLDRHFVCGIMGNNG